MKKEILSIETRLLVAKYGYNAILQSLADTKEVSVEELTSLLTTIENKKNKPKKTKETRDIVEVVQDLVSDNANSELLMKLAKRFQNKMFLPQLKDVRKIFEQAGHDTSGIKSRDKSAKKVFDLLKDFSKEQLASMLEAKPSSTSVFSDLASAIIDGPRNVSSTPSHQSVIVLSSERP